MRLSFRLEGKPKFFRGNWWTLTKSEWVPYLKLANKENWNLGVDDRGVPWKALSPPYAKWKEENYGNSRPLGGRMFDSSDIVVRGNRFIVKTSSEGVYAQFGTEEMPARPWMGVPTKALDKLEELSIKNLLI